MKIEEVPELTLPIIKPNRDYFCQYCDKVTEPPAVCVCWGEGSLHGASWSAVGTRARTFGALDRWLPGS